MECDNPTAVTIAKDKYEVWCDGYGQLGNTKEPLFTPVFPNIPDWCPLEDEETECQ